MRWLPGLAGIALTVCWMTACSPSPVDVTQARLAEPGEATPNISTEELRALMASGSATVFDVRTFLEYSIDHIPGAVHVGAKPGMPASEYTSDTDAIATVVQGDKSAPIVVYCNGSKKGQERWTTPHGRPQQEDHRLRPGQERSEQVAQALAMNSFDNVSYFPGSLDDLRSLCK